MSGPAMRARVRVPASTSNLGGGFDCIGMALPRWLEASVAVRDARDEPPALAIARAGTLATLPLPASDDLLHAGFVAACARAERAMPAQVAYEVASDIPVARGLGSSAAALVAGARLANEALGLGLSRSAVASLVAGIEGHPDNAGPAALGGTVLGVPTTDARGWSAWAFSPLAVHERLAVVLAWPDFAIATVTARGVLPPTVPHGDAVRAAGKGAALVQGLATGDAALLAWALDDVLHVPHRRHLVRGYDAVAEAAGGAGALGATLSGSGSALVAVTAAEDADGVAAAMARAWEAYGSVAETLVVRGATAAE